MTGPVTVRVAMREATRAEEMKRMRARCNEMRWVPGFEF